MQKKHWGYKGVLLAIIAILVISLAGCSSSANKGTEVTPQNVEKQAAAAATSQLAKASPSAPGAALSFKPGKYTAKGNGKTVRSKWKQNSPRPRSKASRC